MDRTKYTVTLTEKITRTVSLTPDALASLLGVTPSELERMNEDDIELLGTERLTPLRDRLAEEAPEADATFARWDVISPLPPHDKVTLNWTYIPDFSMSIRTTQALARAGVTTLADLTGRTRSELLAIDGLGKRTVDDVEQSLTHAGFSFRQEA